MNFDELVDFIKYSGCRVRIHKNKHTTHKALGVFYTNEHGPIISLATKNQTKTKIMATLAHEYGHYCQWRDGMFDFLDNIIDSYTIFHEWVHGRCELTQLEWSACRNNNLLIEWDAEKRAMQLAEEMNFKPFNVNYYLSSAYAYMVSIKWGWDARVRWEKSIPHKYMEPKKLTIKKLLAPLTRKEKELAKKYVKLGK